MAILSDINDNVTITVADKLELIEIAISGTYNMTIALQRAVLARGELAWETVRTYSTANATVADSYITEKYHEHLRLIVTADTSGSATATLTDTNKLVRRFVDDLGNVLVDFYQDGVVFPGSVTADSFIGDASGTDAPYDLVMFINSTHTDNEVLAHFIFVRTVEFPADFDGSLAKSGTTATGATSVLDVQKNGSSIGSLTFTNSNDDGAFSIASAQEFEAGDTLEIIAPSTADATLADIAITLKGTRS